MTKINKKNQKKKTQETHFQHRTSWIRPLTQQSHDFNTNNLNTVERFGHDWAEFTPHRL